MMALTEFGKAVRKARIDTGFTLLTMAERLGTSPAFLSGMETGSKKIPEKWVTAIHALFAEHGYEIPNLDLLANVSNETVSISGLPHQQQMLLGGFAKSEFTQDQLKAFADLLADIHKNNC
ncbi:helix-turn-helix domain-containing protein [Pantoea sp.]|uniref:helix-turn-helix domain-containing protein n=1 Tax=Pantoea sp. TaxID=69393 RepID=UPI0028A84E53|nr:helix-turn-helix domain-containing protein [Pantoea sp.]